MRIGKTALIPFFAGAVVTGGIIWVSTLFVHEGRGNIIRQGEQNYRFINPILACEVADPGSFKELDPIKESVRAVIAEAYRTKNADKVSVYLRTLNSGRWFGINEQERYAPASLSKIFVMMGYLKAAERNPEILDARLQDSPYRTRQLIEKMIVASDNTALTLLIDNATEEVSSALTDLLTDLNIPLPQLEREEELAVMSPINYSLAFRILYGATYLNRSSSESALELLSRTDFTDGIVTGVPEDVTVAHKFGIRSFSPRGSAEVKELHDCGIVYYPSRPYLLCVMTQGNDYTTLATTIQNISRVSYEEIEKFYRTD